MRLPLLLPTLLTLACSLPVVAHPIPDIPVQASFDADGAGVILVEIDLRCFDEDPAAAPYLLNEYLPGKPEPWRAEKITWAQDFVAKRVEFFLEPGGKVVPDFAWTFTGMRNTPLTKSDDPVMLTGLWRSPAGAKSWRLRSMPDNRLSVLFLNQVRGKDIERTQVLFPGESSFVLDLAAAPAAKSTALPWWKRLFAKSPES